MLPIKTCDPRNCHKLMLIVRLLNSENIVFATAGKVFYSDLILIRR